MRLRYTFPALADLASILDYIAERSPQGAARVHSRIRDITNLLLQCPQAGVLTDDPSIRRVTTTPYPYLIFYEVGADEIIVMARETLRVIQDRCKTRRGWPPAGD